MDLKVHELKIWPEYFQQIWSEDKTFEVRKNDRNFNVGDYLLLKEYCPKEQKYTGNQIFKEITYILNDKNYCKEGYVILAIGRTR